MDDIIEKIKLFKEIDNYYVGYAMVTKTLIGAGTMQLLTEIARDHLNEFDTYLEVGCYQAWNFSLISHFAKCKCIAVDNFSQNFKENNNYDLSTRDLVLRNIATIGRGHGNLVEGDFRDILSRWSARDPAPRTSVKLYMYDGPHSTQDQIDGIELALPLLQDKAIIFVDDWASPAVKDSTRHLLRNHEELELIRVLDGPRGRESFNQGQAVFSFRRLKDELSPM